METVSQPVKIYSDASHYSPVYRAQLSDILRPFWKEPPLDDAQRLDIYGLSRADFVVVDTLAQADLAVLPMTWNHYLWRREVNLAEAFIRAARRAGRKIFSYVSWDRGVAVPPEFDDVYVCRVSGFRSRRRKRHFTQPVFFDDPLKHHPELNLQSRGTGGGDRPRVGFCGQARPGVVKLGLDVVRDFWRNLSFHLKLRADEPQPLHPPVLLRARALRVLERSPLVETRFVVRDRYRGGRRSAAERSQTVREFYGNILETDYTLCVRGSGNFSKRFYEALALSRIPLLVDTDCLLPFHWELRWDERVVSVPPEEMRDLPRRVGEHFTAAGAEGLAERQRQNRALWLDWLTYGGFHRKLIRRILDGTAE